MLLLDDDTILVTLDDAIKYVGQPCTCAAAGFRIAEVAVEELAKSGPVVRGELKMVASKEHAVSDVVSFIIGAERRRDPHRNSYVIDDDLSSDPGVWRYIIADPVRRVAVEIVYDKWGLMPDPLRSRLREIEEESERGPLEPAKKKLFRVEMKRMAEVLLDPVKSIEFLEVNSVDWAEFSKNYPQSAKQDHQ